MRKTQKRRIVYLLRELKFSYTTADFLARAMRVENGWREAGPTTRQVTQFLRMLNHLGGVDVKVGRGKIYSYQLQAGWTVDDIERELLL